ncbi:type II secretion system F family protein [soil metagenome]
MEILFSARGLAALAAFGAVALGVITLALVWEGTRVYLRRRSVDRQLKQLTSSDRQAAGARRPMNILKEDRSTLPEWMAPLEAAIPSITDLELFLDQARSTWSVGTFILMTGGFALAGGTVLLVLGVGPLFALAGAAMGAAVPYLLVVRKRKKRVAAFEALFPEVIDLLARSARAGHALQSGLQEVAQEAPDPAGEEFRQVFEEQRFGLPLSESLLGLSDRIQLLDLQMFVTSVLIQKETGGNLAENLDNLSRLVRDRFRFKRDIKTHTAHGRMTGTVLAFAPLGLVLILTVMSPDYLVPLYSSEIGRVIIGLAIGFQLIGFFVIRKMTDLEY